MGTITLKLQRMSNSIIFLRKSRVTSLSIAFSPFCLNIFWDFWDPVFDSAVFKDQQIDQVRISQHET